MIQAVLIAATVLWPATHNCLASMDGATFQGDPSNLALMQSDIYECRKAIAEQEAQPVTGDERRERYFVLGRLYDREAVLLEMGLGMPAPALDAAEKAREAFAHALAASPPDPDYRDAVNANLRLVDEQIATLKGEVK